MSTPPRPRAAPVRFTRAPPSALGPRRQILRVSHPSSTTLSGSPSVLFAPVRFCATVLLRCASLGGGNEAFSENRAHSSILVRGSDE